jgi:hypothetical protein
MKKLQLNINALRVESFTTQPQPRDAGTVHAQQESNTDCDSCFSDLCFGTDGCTAIACPSLNKTCAGTCTHVD